MRESMEELLYEAGTDVVLNGHLHTVCTLALHVCLPCRCQTVPAGCLAYSDCILTMSPAMLAWLTAVRHFGRPVFPFRLTCLEYCCVSGILGELGAHG